MGRWTSPSWPRPSNSGAALTLAAPPFIPRRWWCRLCPSARFATSPPFRRCRADTSTLMQIDPRTQPRHGMMARCTASLLTPVLASLILTPRTPGTLTAAAARLAGQPKNRARTWRRRGHGQGRPEPVEGGRPTRIANTYISVCGVKAGSHTYTPPPPAGFETALRRAEIGTSTPRASHTRRTAP